MHRKYVYMITEFLSKHKSSLIIAGIMILILFIVYFTRTKKEVIDIADEQVQMSEKPVQMSEETCMIKVYVTGEINEEKIIEVESGTILNDIIEKCGGTTLNASKNINLVYEIYENVTIVIKGKNSLDGVDVLKDEGDVTIINEDSGLIKGKVNINTATYDELLLLPGIGQSTANAIINYRNEGNIFKNITDIMKVAGIKEAKYNLIKELIATN